MNDLRRNAPQAVKWSIDLDFSKVSEVLAASFAAYLPFPDGVSERRGSMLAALTNGLPVLSTIGAATPPEMLPLFLPARSSGEALSLLDQLSKDPDRCSEMCVASKTHAARYAWSSIAAQHVLAYQDALRSSEEKAYLCNRNNMSPARRLLVIGSFQEGPRLVSCPGQMSQG